MSRKIKEIILSILSSRRKLTYLILITTLIIVIPVLATYTGPDRTVQEKQCHTEKVITGCYYTMPAEDELHLNCKVASTYPGCPHPAAGFFAGCDGNSQLHYIQEDQEVCVWVDVPAPPATVSGNVSCTNGSNGWCRSDVLLNINGADPNPANSIIAIEGTRNGTDFACAGNTCQIDATGNGTYTFEYWAVSSHGDTSYKGNTTIKIDKDAPSVNLNVSGSMGHNNWYVSNVSWSTNLTDAQSGASHADVTVDGSAQANPGSYGVDGTHTIKATGYDMAGNTNQAQQSVQIDQTNPVPSYTLNGTLGTNGWYTSIVSWNATATDATSGVYAVGTQLDGASVNNSANIGTNGNHTLKVTAQDNAGNLNSTSGSFKIDQENPALTLNLSGTQGTHNWYTGPVSWSSTANDTISGLASHTATLNGSATTVNGSVNADSTYNLNLTAQDNAGNRSTQTQSFGIDQSTPTVSLNAISGTHSNAVQLSGNSADATSGVSYVEISIAGQTHQVSTTGGWTFNWNSNSACNGSVTASVRAVDQAGNSSASSSQTFTVQNTPTTLTLPAQTDASNPVVFNLNTSNLSQMVIRISDDAGKLPAVTQTFTGANIPTSYHWDRYMGDGSLAPKGTYTMNVKIFDKKTCTTDTASITLVVSDSKFSAWVFGAPTNTPIPAQPTATPLPSPTPALESTATQPAIAANTESSSTTETPTNTPTPVVVAFLSPKTEQKTTTTTNDSPKAPTSTSGATTDDTASTLPTGTLIGSAAAGLIGSIAAYQAAKEAERKRREEEARKRAEELQHMRSYLQKNGEDWHGLGMDQMREKVQETKIKVEQEKLEEELKKAAIIAEIEARAKAEKEAKKRADEIYQMDIDYFMRNQGTMSKEDYQRLIYEQEMQKFFDDMKSNDEEMINQLKNNLALQKEEKFKNEKVLNEYIEAMKASRIAYIQSINNNEVGDVYSYPPYYLPTELSKDDIDKLKDFSVNYSEDITKFGISAADMISPSSYIKILESGNYSVTGARNSIFRDVSSLGGTYYTGERILNEVSGLQKFKNFGNEIANIGEDLKLGKNLDEIIDSVNFKNISPVAIDLLISAGSNIYDVYIKDNDIPKEEKFQEFIVGTGTDFALDAAIGIIAGATATVIVGAGIAFVGAAAAPVAVVVGVTAVISFGISWTINKFGADEVIKDVINDGIDTIQNWSSNLFGRN